MNDAAGTEFGERWTKRSSGAGGAIAGKEDHKKGLVAPDEVASGGSPGVGEKFKVVGVALLQLVERHEALLVESQHQQRTIQRLEGSVVNLRKGKPFVFVLFNCA